MKKQTLFEYKGQKASVGHLTVSRLLPNRYVMAVGPFIFLDYLLPQQQEAKTPTAPSGDFAHPHRGIATFSYLFSGELEHFDSKGHNGIVTAGGAQWMNAGNGIIHDENPTLSFQEKGGLLHGLQFWINLPEKIKAEAPGYYALQASDVPEIVLPNNAGVIRVLIGEFEGRSSPVVTYTKQFNYHLKLNANSSFILPTVNGLEYGAFIPANEVEVNDKLHGRGELIALSADGDEIEFTNNGTEAADVMIFGGEPYTEPIIAEGPFVMNSHAEIATAYRDYLNGGYGKIEYDNVMEKAV